MLLALVLALVASPAGSVEVRGERLRELRARSIEAAAPAPWVERRALVVVPSEGGLQIRGRWWIRALKPGWFAGELFADTPGLRVVSARWGAAPAALQVEGGGATLAGEVRGTVEVKVEAFVPGDPARTPLTLKLLPAVSGTIAVQAPEGLRPALRADDAPLLAIDETHWSGARSLELSFVTPATPAADRPPVVVVTVGDAALRGRARAVWEVRQGEVESVTLAAAGLGDDLEVTGANVRAFAREGGQLRVELQAPVRDRVEVELRWSAPIGKGAQSRADMPSIVPAGVFHSEVALQLARDGEVEAIPEAPGWNAVAAASLPAWAQGLVEGTATASLVAGDSAPPGGGSLDLLRFVPLEGPPVVVDVAAYTVATSREGRALVRAHYEVRNERAAQLRLKPPAGFRVIGVRVGGKTATPARATDGSWIVPLLRSVETVQGLLSFPVEVILLGESPAWRRREARRLALPTLDAPVAVSRLTLHLPPGYRSRKQPGDGEVVAAFTRGEGITYGLGVGEVGAAEADALFQEAVGAWMANDFGTSQQKLDALRAMGAKNENIARLQSNLDVVGGKAAGSEDMSLQRRVREQARARAYADVQAQAELKQQAEAERARGDYEASASTYRKALVVGDKLARLEQEESFEQKATNSRLAADFKRVVQSRSARKQRLARRRSGKAKAKDEGVTLHDFDDDAIPDTGLAGGGEPGPDVSAADPSSPDEGEPVVAGPPRDGGGGASPGEPVEGEPVVAGPSPSPATPRAGEPVVAGPPRLQAPPRESEGGAPPGEPVAGPPPLPAPPRESGAPVAAGSSAGEGANNALSAEPGRAGPPPPPAPQDGDDALDGPVDAEMMRPEGVRVTGLSKVVQSIRKSRGRAGRTPRARKKDRATAATPAPEQQNRAAAGLPTPVVHASALSVVVPAVGQAVRYQRLLLPAGAAYAVEISAREPLFAQD